MSLSKEVWKEHTSSKAIGGPGHRFISFHGNVPWPSTSRCHQRLWLWFPEQGNLFVWSLLILLPCLTHYDSPSPGHSFAHPLSLIFLCWAYSSHGVWNLSTFRPLPRPPLSPLSLSWLHLLPSILSWLRHLWFSSYLSSHTLTPVTYSLQFISCWT